jgi:hypothetical protein
MAGMANQLRMGPELAEAVKRARVAAREAGQLLPPRTSAPESPLTPEERRIVAEWHSSGDFDRAVEELVIDDPDLRTQ